MALWLFRLLLLLAVLVSAMMISMWVFAAYIIFAASGAADAESQRWTLSATIFLVVSSGLIALGVYGIVRGWKLSKEQQLGKAAKWVGIPILLQLAVMFLL
ncbi:MAG: hypothetical protein U1E49_14305 [Hyphomicrobiaceae bacterium]